MLGVNDKQWGVLGPGSLGYRQDAVDVPARLMPSPVPSSDSTSNRCLRCLNTVSSYVRIR